MAIRHRATFTSRIERENRYLKNMYRKLAISSGILFSLGILIGFIGIPTFMKYMIKKGVNLRPGSQSRATWEKFPFPLNFGVYVFNVTNADEVQNGGKPKLQEVGPFMFEEWKDKYNIEDIEEEDAITYNMRNTFIFRPDLGLSGEEIITMPHPLIQVMSLSIKRDLAAMMKLIAEGINVIFDPKTPFISAPFMDIFFRGIDVDCSSENYAAIAICLNFHTGNVKGSVKVNETAFKFSLMGGGNYSDAGLFKVSRGIKELGKVGVVLEFDGETELSNWNGEECNRIRGTDSTIFAPLAKRDEALVAFSGDLCRSFAPKYKENVRFDGIPAFRYTMDFGDVKNESENQCYCKNYPDNCPPKGMIDLGPCNETPMFASQPHFLNSDPKLLNDVEGLCPSEERHGIFIDYEIISGTPLSMARRFQFNLDVQPIPELDVMKDMKTLIMPLFWVEETVNLPSEFTSMLKTKVFLTKKINNIFKWVSVVIGALGCCISIYLYYSYKSNRIQMVPPPTTRGEQKY